MSDIAERFRKVAAEFSVRARAVPSEAWDNPSPCEGWVARDIVRHMVAWMPGYFLNEQDLAGPSVDDDPYGAWESLRTEIESALDASDVKTIRAVGAYGIGDVLIHTWDLARATGQDESLDADEVHRALIALSRPEEQVLDNGHFGPSVEVPETADEQTKLLALTGRRS